MDGPEIILTAGPPFEGGEAKLLTNTTRNFYVSQYTLFVLVPAVYSKPLALLPTKSNVSSDGVQIPGKSTLET